MWAEPAANGSKQADRSAGRQACQCAGTGSDHLVEQLNPALLRVGAHDGHGTTHGQIRGALHVGETAWFGALGTARRRHAQYVLVAGKMMLREHGGLLEKDGVPVGTRCREAGRRRGWRSRPRECRGRGRGRGGGRRRGGRAHEPCRPAIVSSTAMRTATPLLTCERMTDWGPSATSDAISMP